jgi:hypothetical protein
MKVNLFSGEDLEFEEPAAGFGWATGTIGDGEEVTVYIREPEHDGGVFVQIDGQLLHAETGEETVQFNNRIWTKSEEAAEIERIKADAQD